MATPFLTGQSLGALRNNFSGCVGLKVTIGASPITVVQLGRWKVAGNSQTHTVKIFNVALSELASVALDLSTGSAAAYLYGSVTPVILAASTAYYVICEEFNTGDQWYDDDTTVTPTAVATVNNSIYRDACAGAINTNLGSNRSYVPVNFQYNTGSLAIPVISHQFRRRRA